MTTSPSPALTAAAATVTKIINDARWMAGLTQAEVAQRAGMSQQMVAQYERGRRQPSVATLTKLVAGCGLQLTWNLAPVAGLADHPTLELLARDPLDRLEPAMATALTALANAARDLDIVVGGKTAARLHGAAVRVREIELWVDAHVDLEVLEAYLSQAGVQYVSPFGEADPAIPDPVRLQEGWLLGVRVIWTGSRCSEPCVSPLYWGTDLHIQAIRCAGLLGEWVSVYKRSGVASTPDRLCSQTFAPKRRAHRIACIQFRLPGSLL